jgi:hypothetical protein
MGGCEQRRETQEETTFYREQRTTHSTENTGETDSAGHLAEGAGVADSAAVVVSCPHVRPTP